MKAVVARGRAARQDIRRDAPERDADDEADDGREVQEAYLEGGPEEGRGLQGLGKDDGGNEGVGDHDAEGEGGEGYGGRDEECEGLDGEDDEVALGLDVREGEEESAAGPELHEVLASAARGGAGHGVLELIGGEVFGFLHVARGRRNVVFDEQITVDSLG